jgi:hypothetical protein
MPTMEYLLQDIRDRNRIAHSLGTASIESTVNEPEKFTWKIIIPKLETDETTQPDDGELLVR